LREAKRVLRQGKASKGERRARSSRGQKKKRKGKKKRVLSQQKRKKREEKDRARNWLEKVGSLRPWYGRAERKKRGGPERKSKRPLL